ncbi:S-methyl-5-thioribose-1-phosphate isomerase [Halorhodospira halochloris]|uniref:Methylthioribose-1-phosphate isomerase n=1 Tax=Halorhodospira halochloris TaxID=1052 RepID=A0A0X8X954_HALHR|nr:S-methyl-5-thioribose-1-phosphate isomerase [Halorhodospira halochloris]MBK1651493.1 S-methyl-5-thioribose-1-phosphate isomerase [Halorhodospira halochloris]MCG5530159.1 S-methyl-5-thioribose-1-phosphate isomerase [Halorhodospira halochloris]MCG5548017.1 S-methyl-5-thioribose-1-phosphate isomerase [Halorhodospira halochloris]BAU57243.1 methylthioribose-1-phosphate isomerase [Halorhodospira halochloris]
MVAISHDTVRALEWVDDTLRLLDQRLLPGQEVYVDCNDASSVATAIADMVVRGAPAIGIAAAYGAAFAARDAWRNHAESWQKQMMQGLEELRCSRPTAVNLAWALQRMHKLAMTLPAAADPWPQMLAEAHAVHEEDVAANRRMGRSGAALIHSGSGVLTHCNTGSLATGGLGTALGVIRTAWADGRISRVFADETRPWLQGSRLTAWELAADGIPVDLLVDGAGAALMRSGAVDWVIVGADRIAANGDVANKIGTYSAALCARQHGVRFMVVAPTSTIDMQLADGEQIPIESRGAEEVLAAGGQRVAPVAEGVGAWNPVFDVTPAELVDVIVTEVGVVHGPDAESMARLFE